MKIRKRQFGMTLTELLVVIAVMALLLGLSVPAAKSLMNSFQSSAGVRNVINAALANARAIAVRHQTYAGVRFQEDAEGNTCLVFIIYDKDATGDAQGFRAVAGRKPMKLPESVGLISGAIANEADKNLALWQDHRWRNANTFSIVFSPAGKLTTHPAQCLRASGNDTIFNTAAVVDAGDAMFQQDDDAALGLDMEDSTQGFIIYDKKQVTVNTDTLWTDYFQNLKIDYISPYTGEIVMEYNDGNP